MMIEIVPAEKGGRTVRINGAYLLSRVDPRREVERVGRDLAGPGKFYLLFGSALGYLPKALEEQGVKKDDILVFEPHPALADDLQRTDPALRQFSPDQGIADLLELKLSERKRPEIFGLESWKRNFPERYATFTEQAGRQVRIAVENLKVTLYFSKVWFLNLFRNLKDIQTGGPARPRYLLDEIRPVTDLPVVVAASGPSLAEHWEDIRRRRDELLLVAVLSACRPLRMAGIDPDAVVVSDAGASNILHASGLKAEIPVFANVYANSALLSRLPNPVVYYNLREEMGRLSFQLRYPSVTMDAGSLAAGLTSGSVVFWGFDLAYHVRSGSHSPGNALLDLREKSHHRLNPRYRSLSAFLSRNDILPQDSPSDGSRAHWFTQKQFSLVASLAESSFAGSFALTGGSSFRSIRKIGNLGDILVRGSGNRKMALEKISGMFVGPESYGKSVRFLIQGIERDLLAANSALTERILLRESLSGMDLHRSKRYYLDKVRRLKTAD